MSFPTISPAINVPLTIILPSLLSHKCMGHFVTALALLGQTKFSRAAEEEGILRGVSASFTARLVYKADCKVQTH